MGHALHREKGTLNLTMLEYAFTPAVAGPREGVHMFSKTGNLENVDFSRDGQAYTETENRHVLDFMRARENRSRPIADIEEGHISSACCELANLSQQLGRPVAYDPKSRTVPGDAGGDPPARPILPRALGSSRSGGRLRPGQGLSPWARGPLAKPSPFVDCAGLTSIPIAVGAGRDTDHSFLGHPRGLAYIAFTEAWERFSYYGMQTLLVLYMVRHLLLPGHIERIAGFALFRAAIERGYGGPLSNIALSSAIFGLYTGLVYLTPIGGGLIADRWLGRTRTITIGALLMAAGQFLMAFETSSWSRSSAS